MVRSKLFSLASSMYSSMPAEMDIKALYISGYKQAFKDIDENLTEELVKLAEFQPHGERLMTLKLYKAKIAGILKEMEQDYE